MPTQVPPWISVMPGQPPHRKGSADHGKSFGSNDIQRMCTLPTFESSAREHLVTETLGDISPLNTTELALYLDRPQYLTLQADPDRHLSAPGACSSTSHLPAWLSKLLQAMPASKTYNKKRFKRTTRSGAAFMRTLRWKFPVGLHAGEFTFGCKNNAYCCISPLYLLSCAEITAVCAAL